MENARKPLNEDRVALLLGSIIFILALLKFGGVDILGWAVKTGMWVDNPLDAWKSASKGMLPGYGALLTTYVVLTAASRIASSSWEPTSRISSSRSR